MKCVCRHAGQPGGVPAGPTTSDCGRGRRIAGRRFMLVKRGVNGDFSLEPVPSAPSSGASYVVMQVQLVGTYEACTPCIISRLCAVAFTGRPGLDLVERCLPHHMTLTAGTPNLEAIDPSAHGSVQAAAINAPPTATQAPARHRRTDRGDEPVTPPLPSPPQTPQCEARRAAAGHFAGLAEPALLVGGPAAVPPSASSGTAFWSPADQQHDSEDDARCCSSTRCLPCMLC